MDQKVLAIIEEMRKAGKCIENFEEVLVIVLQALTGIAQRMNEDGMSDNELNQFDEFIDVVKSAIEYEKECRETAYNSHIDSKSSTNKCQKVSTPESVEEYIQNLIVKLTGAKNDKDGEIA